MKTRTFSRLWSFDHWWTELLSAIALALYGLVAIDDTFILHEGWPPEMRLNNLLPAGGWESLILLVAASQMLSLALDHIPSRLICAFGAGWLACWAAYNFYAVNARFSPEIVFPLIMMGVNMVSVSRLLRRYLLHTESTGGRGE